MFCATFYSFKGGVGRTMAVANVANLLAANGSRVLVVDFDLEAPGLSSYEPFLGSVSERGIVDLDSERRAAMVSNLLVVLCSENDTQPVINTGTLYQ